MNLLDKYIDSFNPSVLMPYLSRNGWDRLTPLLQGAIEQYRSADHKYVLKIPIQNDFYDYDIMLKMLLKSLSNAENKTENEMLNILMNPASDVVKWRINDQTTCDGSILMDAMSKSVDYIHQLIVAGVADCLKPQTYHHKLTSKEIEGNMQNFRFGQTAIGSYVLTILCSLGFYEYDLFDNTVSSLPIARRVNQSVMKNIDIVQRAYADRSQQLNEEVDAGGMSVNFLRALKSLYETNKDSELTIHTEWNHKLPMLDAHIPSLVQFEPRSVDYVSDAIERFTPKVIETENVFHGKITNIAGEGNAETRQDITIKVATIAEGGKQCTIVVTLDNAEYGQMVTSAFDAGRTIRVQGMLGKGNKIANAVVSLAN